MSTEAFTIAYDGPALRGGAMDVRDLAPALLGLGQLFDAANMQINGPDAVIKLQVKATEHGSFQVALELSQSWSAQVLTFFGSPEVTGAATLLGLVLGGWQFIGGSPLTLNLVGLVKKMKGGQPDSIKPVADNAMEITFGGETFTVPLELLRLYQDLAVRTAVEKVINAPLLKDGIDTFYVKRGDVTVETVDKAESIYFIRPSLPDEVLVDETRRSAFSIVSLAFKEDNKWRLYDGNTQISATISDLDFLQKVDANQISFSKGDILICDVKVTQRRTTDGLRTDYIVEKVIEHRPAARQLPLPLPKP